MPLRSIALRRSGSACATGLAISSVCETRIVSSTFSPAARNARPVSVSSTTASAISGTFASVAPYESEMSASTPCFSVYRRVSSGYSLDTRTPVTTLVTVPIMTWSLTHACSARSLPWR